MSGGPGPAGLAAAHKAIVTGIGVAAPNGTGIDDYWDATLQGVSGIARLTRFDPSGYPAQLAAQTDIDTSAYLPSRLLVQTDHMTRLALVAAGSALQDAAAAPGQMPGHLSGVLTAATGGGTEFAQRELQALWSTGNESVSAYHSFAWFYPVNSGQISIRHGMRGPGGGLVTGQAGGLDAIGAARRHLRDDADLMLTGGVDGSLCPWAWVAMIQSGELTTATDPARAYLPFDTRASGYVPGEGGALLVLEDEQAARSRRARHAYGEIAGYAAAFDARPGQNQPTGLRRAIDLALADAGTPAGGVDAVYADAYGVPELDRAEAETLASVFGPRGVPVAAPKVLTGRLGAGGAALDVAAALLSLRDQVLPPAAGVCQQAYPGLIDLVTGQPRTARLSCILVAARGRGGFNSAVVLKAAGKPNSLQEQGERRPA